MRLGCALCLVQATVWFGIHDCRLTSRLFRRSSSLSLGSHPLQINVPEGMKKNTRVAFEYKVRICGYQGLGNSVPNTGLRAQGQAVTAVYRGSPREAHRSARKQRGYRRGLREGDAWERRVKGEGLGDVCEAQATHTYLHAGPAGLCLWLPMLDQLAGRDLVRGGRGGQMCMCAWHSRCGHAAGCSLQLCRMLSPPDTARIRYRTSFGVRTSRLRQALSGRRMLCNKEVMRSYQSDGAAISCCRPLLRLPPRQRNNKHAQR